MQQHHVSLSSYNFRRSKRPGLIEVVNEGLYVMAEYSELTGAVKWQRVVPATQRDQIERWLGEHYPVQESPRQEPRTRTAVPAARATGAAKSAGKSL
jgi:hypothetical protein